MNNLPKGKHQIFYNHNKPATLINSIQHTHLFLHFHPAAEISSTAAQKSNTLTLADSHSSIVRAKNEGLDTPFSYSPYGHAPNNTEFTPLLCFNGELKSTLGLYALGRGRRFYSPELMRFISSDPAGPFLQDNFNTYAYCSADPVNYHDPSGLIGEPKVKINALRNKYINPTNTVPDFEPTKKSPSKGILKKVSQPEDKRIDRLVTLNPDSVAFKVGFIEQESKVTKLRHDIFFSRDPLVVSAENKLPPRNLSAQQTATFRELSSQYEIENAKLDRLRAVLNANTRKNKDIRQSRRDIESSNDKQH